jgi:hypothetical protein
MGTVAVFFVGLEEESDRAGPAVISGELRSCPQKHRHVSVVATGVHMTGGLRGIWSRNGFGDEQAIEFGAEADGFGTRSLGFAGDHAGTTDTSPVKLSYRNVLDSDTLSIGSYIKNLNNFREWWNKSPVSSIVSAPALSPKTAPLALANPEVVASISFTSSTITRTATSPLLLDDGYRVRFSTSASTQQSTNITLSIAHQGFSFSKTFEAKVNP